MSADHWRSEAVIYGLMFFNMAALVTGLVWAWRRGYLTNLDDRTTGLQPGPDGSQESDHG
jgi:hypothetical protein